MKQVLLMGDTHGDLQDFIWHARPFVKDSGKQIVQLGDFGFLWAGRNNTKGLSNWLVENDAVNLVNEQGVQLAAISYPHLSKDEIFHSMEVFYRRFYFRPSKIWEIVREMLSDWQMLKRRLREGVEFFRFLRAREA